MIKLKIKIVMKHYIVRYNIFGQQKEMNLLATGKEMAQDLVFSLHRSKLGVDKDMIKILSVEKNKIK